MNGPVDSNSNNRTRTLNGETVFRTVDNGGGYWIVQCPFFEMISDAYGSRIDKCIGKLEEGIKELKRKGVSPDTAANNVGYIIYAAIGGQARKEEGDKNNVDKVR